MPKKPKYEIYDDGSEFHHKIFKTTNLNSFGRTNQQDDLIQTLKVIKPKLSDLEILNIITTERIRRCEMEIGPAFIDRILKINVPEYIPTKAGKKVQLKEVLDECESGKTIIRLGKDLVVYDADTGRIYSGISKLYAQRTVSVYWKEM